MKNENLYKRFFLVPQDRKHILYESLRKSFVESKTDKEICDIYKLNFNTFRTLKQEFRNAINNGQDAAKMFFEDTKVGKREKEIPEIEEKIINLRKNNLSVTDIKAILSSEKIHLSLWKIDTVLKEHNFPVLPRRSQTAKQQLILPDSVQSIESTGIEELPSEKFESLGGSIFVFAPLLAELGIDKIIRKAGYPDTKAITGTQAILSFLALKLMSTKRLSHSNDYNIDRGLGLFAGLTVLPKSAWFSSYSYRVTRGMNIVMLSELHKAVRKITTETGDFNLDFTAIPHWGDESVLEKNWSGKRNKGIKSVLALVVQEQGSQVLTYGNAEIEQKEQSEAIIEFVDFYKNNGGKLNCLVFDSKFTTYEHLSKLNQDGIKFITLRRRSGNLILEVNSLDESQWKRVTLDKEIQRKHRNLLVQESMITLPDYEGTLRQIVITNNGREKPTFLITNDLELSTKALVLKYARRWLVEQLIAEQIDFYHLNSLSSSIVVKVDFDLTMSIFADTVYRLFTKRIPRFAKSRADTIYRLFVKNYASFIIDSEGKTITITLNKKVHLASLAETGWLNKLTKIPWLSNYKLFIKIGTSL